MDTLTFHYLRFTIHLAYPLSGGEEIAHFLHEDDCEKFCEENHMTKGYMRSPAVDNSVWANLMYAHQRYTVKPEPKPVRCTLQVPLRAK